MTANDVALEALDLPELEEAIGEIQRRIGVALRRLGEQRADAPDSAGMTPRREVAALAAGLELAALTIAAVRAGARPPAERIDRHPSLAAGLMYAAPTIPALLQRLEQDRRLLTSLARGAGERLDEELASPWGPRSTRGLLVEAGLRAGARCAIALEGRRLQADA